MTDSKPSHIVTKGDARVNVIDALGDLSHVSYRIQKTIDYLYDYLRDGGSRFFSPKEENHQPDSTT